MLRKNLLANFSSLFIATSLALLCVPFYLKWLGADAYGLVGLASMVQAWIMLLSAAVMPVMGRQAAQAHAGTITWHEAAVFFKAVDWFFFVTSSVLIVIAILCVDWLANNWLGQTGLKNETVKVALVMLLVIALARMSCSVNYGVLANAEAQVWMGWNVIVFSFLRFAVSLPLIYFSKSVELLFLWWCISALLELVSIKSKIKRIVSVTLPFFLFDFSHVKKHARIALPLFFTGLIWVLLTQLDKLVLSSILPLSEYAYFSVATLLASCVLLVSQPVGQAFQPRITKAYSVAGLPAALDEFSHCTRWVVLLIFPLASILIFLPESVVYVWTGDQEVARRTADIMRGYVAGNVLVGVGGLLYMLQVAIGNVRLHFWGNVIFAVILVPFVPIVANRYGAEGAAWLWASTNLFIFVFWNAFVLRKLANELFPKWILVQTLLPLAVTFLVGYIFSLWLVGGESRLYQFFFGVLAFIVTSMVLVLVVKWPSRKSLLGGKASL